MGCVKSSVFSPIEEQETIRNTRQLHSVPVQCHGYLLVEQEDTIPDIRQLSVPVHGSVPVEQEDTIPDIRPLSVPVHGYLPVEQEDTIPDIRQLSVPVHGSLPVEQEDTIPDIRPLSVPVQGYLPVEDQDTIPDIRQLSVPVHGYLPVSPVYQQAGLGTSSSRQSKPNLIHVLQNNTQGSSISEHPFLKDPKFLGMATFDFSGEEASNKKQLKRQSVSTEIEKLSNEELNRINDFLNYLDSEELLFKRPSAEVSDIKNAVDKAVDSFGNFISQRYPLLTVSHKHAVGSFAEGTRLEEPDEFDFILVLNYFNEDNVSVERCLKDCDGIADVKPHAHIKIKNMEWWNAEAPKDWQDSGTICNWLNFVDKHLFSWTDCEWNVDIDTPSGTLSNSETDLEFTTHGPAFTFQLLWTPKQGKRLLISIDASLALERKGVTDVIDLEDVPCQEFIPDLLKEDTHFIVYGEGQEGFKYTFTTTEVKLMQNASASHRQCYRIMKFLMKFCGSVASYILKTLLLRHANTCKDDVFLLKCLDDILTKIEDLYKQRKGGVRTIFLPDVKKNIEGVPQIGISRFVLFIENELIKIGKSHQSDNGVCLGQLQQMMCMNLLNEIEM